MSLLASGIELTIIGMGVVFLSLFVLMLVVQVLDRLSSRWGRDNHWKEEKEGSRAETAEDPREVDLVLAAAAGYFLESERAEVFVPEVRRNPESSWARLSRAGRPTPRRLR